MKLARLALVTLLVASASHAQQMFGGGYDDYGSFSTDPVDLDTETSDIFGRFFQNSLRIGTAIPTGGLGQAYSPGISTEVKFVFYFDKIWAGELSAGWSQFSGIYNNSNTRPGQTVASDKDIEIQLRMTMVPVQFGFRYGFDPDLLPRGFAATNPYLSVNAELVFRTEAVVGTPVTEGLDSTLKATYTPNAIISGKGYGVNFGGGMEFDVYRRKVFLGLDLRYHLLMWSDADALIGELDRRGHLVSILGSMTYNY